MIEGRSTIRSRTEDALVTALAFTVIVATLAPIVVVVAMSFTASNVLQFPPPSWSVRWYEEVWELLFGVWQEGSPLRTSLITSLQIAVLTALIAVACGVPAAYALSRYQFAGREFVELAFSLPMVFPTIVLGVSLLVALSAVAADLGLWQIVVAHIIITLPFVIRNCYAAIHGVDPALEEAARTLGASALAAFIEVVFPLMRSGIVAAFLLVFIISMNEFTLAYFLYTVDSSPISIWLFQQSNTALDPKIFAVSTLLILVNIAVILIVERAFGAKSMSF